MSERVQNTLFIAAPTEHVLQAICASVFKSAKEPFSLNRVIPMPHSITDATEWEYDNWGCKHDAYDVKTFVARSRDFVGFLAFQFMTVNGYPKRVLLQLSREFPTAQFVLFTYLAGEDDRRIEFKNGEVTIKVLADGDGPLGQGS